MSKLSSLKDTPETFSTAKSLEKESLLQTESLDLKYLFRTFATKDSPTPKT
ncbi:hypothetical protein QIA37_00340 (plasmid) [Borrelia sp. CA_690]|uniref:hypothetical protein n=1 Tax=Borrelia TaxID=138 RepID=UPI001E2BD615|nr:MULTISPECIES: hypothetical protein [Borrelia]WKC83977.1 hypothetical protein QIA37_00340 [Borrelia sp. CA_690]